MAKDKVTSDSHAEHQGSSTSAADTQVAFGMCKWEVCGSLHVGLHLFSQASLWTHLHISSDRSLSLVTVQFWLASFAVPDSFF